MVCFDDNDDIERLRELFMQSRYLINIRADVVLGSCLFQVFCWNIGVINSRSILAPCVWALVGKIKR